MSLGRSLLWARIITLVGFIFAIGNFLYLCLTPERASVWSVGLDVYFAAMTIYGLILWRRARKRLKEFEDANGRDAGRQDTVK